MKFKRKHREGEVVYEYNYKMVYLQPQIFEKIKREAVDDKISISQLIEKLYNFYEEKNADHVSQNG